MVELYKDAEKMKSLSDVDRALIMYYLLLLSFNSKLSNISFVTKPTSARKLNSVNTIQNIYRLAALFQGVELTNYSYETILTFPWIKDNASKWLIYADPPYYVSTAIGTYYAKSFTHEDHIKLFELLDDLRKNNIAIVVSYDDHPFIRELYKNWEFYVIKDVPQISATTEGSAAVRNEILFFSYSLDELGLFNPKLYKEE